MSNLDAQLAACYKHRIDLREKIFNDVNDAAKNAYQIRKKLEKHELSQLNEHEMTLNLLSHIAFCQAKLHNVVSQLLEYSKNEPQNQLLHDQYIQLLKQIPPKPNRDGDIQNQSANDQPVPF
jgi:hypothetical protein